MAIYEKYVNRVNFKDYDDLKENLQILVPENFNFAYDVLDKLGEENPDGRALVWCNHWGDKREFTYGEMSKLTNKAANLLTRYGIKKGDKVMLILKRHYQFWYILMALHKIGAVAVPATNLLTPKDIVYRNNRATIKCVIATSDPGPIDHVNDAEADSPSLEIKIIAGGRGSKDYPGWINFDKEIENESDFFQRPTGELATKNDDLMILYFTSGTTGQPKMVAHDFTYPLGHIITATHWHRVKKDGLHLTIAETGWAKAVWGKMYGQWLGECGIFVFDMEKFVPTEILSIMEEYRLTSFCAPPTMYRFMMREDMSSFDLSSLEELTVAGEALNPEVFNQIQKATKIKMRECYGQTEVVALVCTFEGMEAKPGSMGKPSPCYHVEIINENKEACMPGEIGEIVINTSKGRPTGMFQGYYRDQEQTKATWYDNIYYTGDQAYKDETGYYWYVGRADDVIKSSGYKIGPFEVESALIEHPAVLECAITGVPDEIRGQIVKATIVLTKGYKGSDQLAKELQDHVKNVTAPYKYPRIIEFVEELPKTISGKIRHVEIRNRDKDQ